jgi:hypothetical protein
MQNTFDYKKLSFIGGSLALFSIAFLALITGITTWKTFERGSAPASISVTGTGEVTAIPDIATITFAARESAKTVPEAQAVVDAKIKAALASLASLGVSDKDMKTTSYTVNPVYNTQPIYCITVPCPQGKTVITGYEVANIIQVKIRKIENAGQALAVLGTDNITEVSGPNFNVDNMDAVTTSAKDKAIVDAKAKALTTAKSLGVELGDITQYSENAGGYYPAPYAMGAMAKASDALSLPQGENVIKSQVTITYSIH